MIPYNPSSFNSNKTILEQILELKNWLKEHPSYRIFASSENGNTSMTSTYDLTQVEENADLDVGDVVLFHNGCIGCVSSVDRDNNEFDCNYPCTNIKGPQGPRGYVTSITNTQVDANGDLKVTIYNPDTQTSSTYNAGHVVGADGTNGTNGTDGAYISNAQIDANGDLIVTIYDPETSTSTNINAGSVTGNIEGTSIKSTGVTSGQVLQADGSGGASWQTPSGGIESVSLSIGNGTLTDSDYNKLLTDGAIIIGSNNRIYEKAEEDSSTIIFKCILFSWTTDNRWGVFTITKATKAYVHSWDYFTYKSGSATNGQILTANGSGGASWQNASGGSFTHYAMVTSSSGTLSQTDYDNLTYEDSVFIHKVNSTTINIFRKISDDGSHINFEYINVAVGTLRFTIDKVSRAYSRTTYGFRSGSIDSQSATNGQVLMANGNGGASWQNAGGGTTLNKYTASITGNASGYLLMCKILENAKSISNITNVWSNIPCTFGIYSSQYIKISGTMCDNNVLFVGSWTLNHYDVNAATLVTGNSYSWDGTTFSQLNATTFVFSVTYYNDSEIL